MSAPRRIVIAGATGAMGTELLEVLAASRIEVAEILPVATERSLGDDVEYAGRLLPVESEMPVLRGVDLVVLCTPAAAALEWVRACLRAEVPCIDLSGALATSEDVPLLVHDLGFEQSDLHKPIIHAATGPELALLLALYPLEERFGLNRAVVTALESASSRGRDGIDVLQNEVVALFNQEELPEPVAFSRNIAFDCLPEYDEEDRERGTTPAEQRVADALSRWLPELAAEVMNVQVPTFSGTGLHVSLELRRAASVEEAAACLEKSPAVERFTAPAGPTTRDPSGRDTVLVGRLRADGQRLRLWLSADTLRLSAANAVRLAEARFAALS